MKRGKALWLSLLVGITLAPTVSAQPQAFPGAPAAAPAAAPANLWSFLCPTAEQKAACKTAFCNSPLGQLSNSAAGPVSAVTGGLFPNRCLQNSIANGLKKPADDPEGLAARVMADEEEAKQRRAAVRFLGTVDCNYWPEAKDTLIKALRKDRNECVRFEAALALRSGCCCNAEVVEALKLTVMGANTDGNPAERSDRVRAAAADALMMCVLPTDPEPIEGPKEKLPQKVSLPPDVDPADYYKKIAKMPREKVVAGARNVLVSLQKGTNVQPIDSSSPALPPVPPVGVLQRPTSVTGIVTNAFAPAPGPRQPFFSGLTKSLTGRQDAAPPSAPSPEPMLAPPARSVPGIVVAQPIRR